MHAQNILRKGARKSLFKIFSLPSKTNQHCGCRSWVINETSYNDIDIFLPSRNINAFGVMWSQMMYEHITNGSILIRDKLYKVQDTRHMITIL